MRRNTWPVGFHALRPAGKPTECFYCREVLGSQHRANCPLRQRTVVVKLEIELVVTVPEDWSEDMVTFFYGAEGSACQSNLVDLLVALRDRTDEQIKDECPHCLCPMIDGSYLREASEADENDQDLHVEQLPS